MKRTRVSDDAADRPPLSAAVRAVVLGGWSAGRGIADDDGLFELWAENLPGVARLWREHEVFLRAEAKRLGIEPREPGGRFFGEVAGERM